MQEIVEELLFEEESTTLDYKSEQYKFSGATTPEKGELLKDILAFANAWRRTDGYILVGVKEKKGERAEIKGVSTHIDDAQLQQFVNKKTQRPVDFSYTPFEFEGKQIGIIKIGPQDRPIYLKKDFGKLKKHEVYLRRGSSTDIASPDEIAKMGSPYGEIYAKEPKLIFGFADREEHKILGEELTINTVKLEISKEEKIPNYGGSRVELGGLVSRYLPDMTKNKDYYRDLANYYKKRIFVSEINFYIHNESGIMAKDVNVELIISDPENNLTLLTKSRLPSKPNPSNLLSNIHSHHIQGSNKNDLTIKKLEGKYLANISFEKVKAKQTLFSDSTIYIGSNVNAIAEINLKIYSDNLSEPLSDSLSLRVEVENKTVNSEQIVELVS